MRIEPCSLKHVDGWLTLRCSLWPDGEEAEHRAEIEAQLRDADPHLTALVALVPLDDGSEADGPGADGSKADGSDAIIGFAEAALRHDYVNGCDSSPVLFLEGLFVAPEHRRRGVARALCEAVAAWGRTRGCSEFASDADLTNHESHAMHRALGFDETERVVYFRKPLD